MLVPTSFLFRYQIPIRRHDGMPGRRGRLLNLSESMSLPNLGELAGQAAGCDLRVAWNPRGVGLQVGLPGSRGSGAGDSGSVQEEHVPVVLVWFDTRPTPDAHRAGRYCSLWRLTLRTTDDSEERNPEDNTFAEPVQALPIPRSRDETPLARAESIVLHVYAERGRTVLEAWFPKESLPGYDPEASSKLGFFYRIETSKSATQMLWEGGDFPSESDPSLWPTLLLQD